MYFPKYDKWFISAAYLTNKLTKDGKQIVIHLIRDINDRKQTEEKLELKITELEKWQRLTTGREVKMSELKSKIKALEQEIIELKVRIKKYELV